MILRQCISWLSFSSFLWIINCINKKKWDKNVRTVNYIAMKVNYCSHQKRGRGGRIEKQVFTFPEFWDQRIRYFQQLSFVGGARAKLEKFLNEDRRSDLRRYWEGDRIQNPTFVIFEQFEIKISESGLHNVEKEVMRCKGGIVVVDSNATQFYADCQLSPATVLSSHREVSILNWGRLRRNRRQNVSPGADSYLWQHLRIKICQISGHLNLGLQMRRRIPMPSDNAKH